MLSKTKKVFTTHLTVLCSIASYKLFYRITWRVETLSLLFVPPTERRRNGDYYVQLRCFYFRNLYDELLSSISKNRAYIFEQMEIELRIQILLLMGRVFYIRGDLETSLIIYLLSYQFAISDNKTSLAIKAIHRIAMIELCKGLYSESKNTFLKLTKLDVQITPKRKSFAYYRIAKCCFALDELEDSIDYSKKSISIKESYNDKRGILFSYKMLSKVYFKNQAIRL